MQENISNIIVYNDGELELKVSVEQEIVWLNQKSNFAEIIWEKKPNINMHIKTILSKQEVNFLKIELFRNTCDSSKRRKKK